MSLSDGSILRGSDALISDARGKVSEIKLLLRDALEAISTRPTLAVTDIKDALSLLMELDDRG